MWEITADTGESQRIIRTYFTNLYYTKLKNVKERYNFVNKNYLPNMNQNQIKI